MDASSRDEIDLQELAVRIIRYFRGHLAFILFFCASGIALGVTAYKLLPNIYESQMVVYSDLLTKTYGDRIGLTLNKLVKEENQSQLSVMLGMPVEHTANINAIEVECVTDIKMPQREKVEKDESYFIITVEVRDPSILPELQSGLLGYIRSNELVKVKTKQREELGNAIVNKIDRELRSIDSLKQMLFQSGQFKAEKLMFDPAALFTEGVNLTKLRWEAQQELELASTINLVEGFTAFQKPKSPKLSVMIVLGFFLGLFGAVSLLTLRHLIKMAFS
jgi:hypothetical protein